MAVDLQLVHPQDVIPVQGVAVIELGNLWVAAVLGGPFDNVSEVYVNGVLAPEVFVVRSDRILVQLPEILQTAERPNVTSVEAVTKSLEFSSESLLRFRLGSTPGKAVGVHRLVQLFFKVLLTTPGTDIFNPTLGGGLLQVIGRNYSGSTNGSGLVADAVVSVASVARQIMTLQTRNQRLPRNERLLSATVLGSRFDPNLMVLYLQIKLLTQAGTSALLNLAG